MKNRRASQKAASPSALLQIVYRGIDQLEPDLANPRRHSKKQVRQIAESIRVFGFNVPILIDRHGNVIAGHGRRLAAQELGWTEVPTVCLDHLTLAQVRTFRIADKIGPSNRRRLMHHDRRSYGPISSRRSNCSSAHL